MVETGKEEAIMSNGTSEEIKKNANVKRIGKVKENKYALAHAVIITSSIRLTLHRKLLTRVALMIYVINV